MTAFFEWFTKIVNGEIKNRTKFTFIFTALIIALSIKKIYYFISNAVNSNELISTIFIITLVIPVYFITEFIVILIEKLFEKIKTRTEQKNKLKSEEEQTERNINFLIALISFMTHSERKLLIEMFTAAKNNSGFNSLCDYDFFTVVGNENIFEFKERQLYEKVGNPIRGELFKEVTSCNGGILANKFSVSFHDKNLANILENNNILEFPYVLSYMSSHAYIKELKKKFGKISIVNTLSMK